MTSFCLDTSAYSQFKRGEPGAVQTITTATRIGIPAVVLGELRAGFAIGSRRETNERELLAFLGHPVIDVLMLDDAASMIYADILTYLRRSGTPIPTNDIWIAAIAAREGLPVLTYDTHFESIARVSVRLLRNTQ
jgi:tRNA(fMet)-specific endonuclease VapC